jgi:hypothetical protein
VYTQGPLSAARRAGTATRRRTAAAGAAGSLASASSTVLSERVASDQPRLNDRVYTTMDRGRLAIAVAVAAGITLTIVLVAVVAVLVWRMLFFSCLIDPIPGTLG